jgi:hypothetical protein
MWRRAISVRSASDKAKMEIDQFRSVTVVFSKRRAYFRSSGAEAGYAAVNFIARD